MAFPKNHYDNPMAILKIGISEYHGLMFMVTAGEVEEILPQYMWWKAIKEDTSVNLWPPHAHSTHRCSHTPANTHMKKEKGKPETASKN